MVEGEEPIYLTYIEVPGASGSVDCGHGLRGLCGHVTGNEWPLEKEFAQANSLHVRVTFMYKMESSS